jgi:hypothetical protein
MVLFKHYDVFKGTRKQPKASGLLNKIDPVKKRENKKGHLAPPLRSGKTPQPKSGRQETLTPNTRRREEGENNPRQLDPNHYKKRRIQMSWNLMTRHDQEILDEIRQINDLEKLEKLATKIKTVIYLDKQDPVRDLLLNILNSKREQLKADKQPIQWHTAPDGSPCCCTAEDRRYGCGCR